MTARPDMTGFVSLGDAVEAVVDEAVVAYLRRLSPIECARTVVRLYDAERIDAAKAAHWLHVCGYAP